jgi:hypothetical protein
MKLTTVIGTVIAALSLVACGSRVAPTVSPTLALAVAPTVPATTAQTATATPTPTAMPAPPTPTTMPVPPTLVLTETCDGTANADYAGTVSFSGGIEGYMFSVYGPGPAPFNYNAQVTTDANGDGTLTPAADPPPSLGSTVGTYEYAYAHDGVSSTILGSFAIVACLPPATLGYTNTCADTGTPQGGSLTITFSGTWESISGTYPDSITVDGGSAVDVTSNPFTSGPYTVGDHVFTTDPQGIEPVNENGWPFRVGACPVITVTTTCSPPGHDDGFATFSGVTVGYSLAVGNIEADPIPSNPWTITVGNPGLYSYTESGESYGVITRVTGTFTIAACAVPTPRH